LVQFGVDSGELVGDMLNMGKTGKSRELNVSVY
jgi:hypothetical protein